MIISMKLVYQYMTIFFNLSLTSNHLHPLQVENCGSNSRLVVDGYDNRKFRLERVKQLLKHNTQPSLHIGPSLYAAPELPVRSLVAPRACAVSSIRTI